MKVEKSPNPTIFPLKSNRVAFIPNRPNIFFAIHLPAREEGTLSGHEKTTSTPVLLVLHPFTALAFLFLRLLFEMLSSSKSLSHASRGSLLFLRLGFKNVSLRSCR